MSTDLEQCRRLLEGGSRTFHAASLLLPRRVRDPAAAVYAFCRLADDAIDDGGDAAAALAALRDRLDRIYQGRPIAIAADRAFAEVVERFGLPRALPEALLEGFQWDAERRRYESLDDLCAYAVRVAGTVGGMMTLLMGARDPAVMARAIELGVAMQLTNIARDVGEDARAGRLYLPLRWLQEAGIDPDEFLANPRSTQVLGSVVQRLLRAAQLLYERAESGIAHLPAACRPSIAAARWLYAEIGSQVERNGYDSVSQRAVLPRTRKLMCLGGVAATSLRPAKPLDAPVLAEARFLVDALASSPERTPSLEPVVAWWQVRSRALWVIDLFERLEREQLRRANS